MRPWPISLKEPKDGDALWTASDGKLVVHKDSKIYLDEILDTPNGCLLTGKSQKIVLNKCD